MKVHKRDVTEKAEDWVQSPHIHRAVLEGTFTMCRKIIPYPEFVTDDPDQVTCQACILKMPMRGHTCDKCRYWVKPEDHQLLHEGGCELMVDPFQDPSPTDRCFEQYPEEGQSVVGPKFGCIHWEKKVVTGSPGGPVTLGTENLTKE